LWLVVCHKGDRGHLGFVSCVLCVVCHGDLRGHGERGGGIRFLPTDRPLRGG